jgi:hypothetical protein
MLTGFCGFTCGKGTTLMSSITLGPNCATLPAWVMNIETRPLGTSSAGSALVATLTVGSEILYLCTYMDRTCMAFTPASPLAVHFFPARSRMLPPYCRVRPSRYHMVHAEECMAKSNASRVIVVPCVFTSFWPTRPMSSQVRG